MTSRQTEPELWTLVRAYSLKWEQIQFIDIGMENPVYETDTGTFVRVLVWQLNVNFPKAA